MKIILKKEYLKNKTREGLFFDTGVYIGLLFLDYVGSLEKGWGVFCDVKPHLLFGDAQPV